MESSNTGIPRLPIAHDDDDDEDEDEGSPREGESWFAGGERSGISVQNPNARGNVPGGRMVQDILRRAAEMSAARTSQPSADHDSSTAFRGGGHTLGSDDVESTFVPDPDVQLATQDPENERLLAEINTGRAPVSVLNVRPGQPVEVVVSKRTDEDYVPEKRPFGGSGNRLGSPVPAVTTNMPGSFPTGPSAPAPASRSTERASVTTVFEVDQTQPMTTVQIRLADGTRMPCRMNLTHTVGDIRYFINASRPENTMRPYTIGTTFPNRVLDNDQVTIQSAGLANSVVVQRWV
ncbi:ubiquitin-related domain-containing protein [Boletus edulis]|nr:ubiquitin-related domain-containing protein [Boletus edulis]